MVGVYGFAWQKAFVLGDSKTLQVSLQRNYLGELIISPHQLNYGDNTVTATMTDKDNSVDQSATVTLLKNLTDKVAWNKIDDVSLFENHLAQLPIDNTSIISGNNLQVSAVSDNTDVLTIDSAFYAKKVDITWDKVSSPAGNFYFAGQASVIEMITPGGSKSLVFSLCTQAGPGQAIACTVLQTIPIKKGDIVGDKILYLSNDLIVAYTTNDADSSSTLYGVNKTQSHIHLHKNDIFTDIAGFAGATSSLDYVAVSIIDHVVVLEVNPNDITEWTPLIHLDAEHFDETDFCPTELRSQKIADGRGWFIILSNCNNGKQYSQEIFTWACTPKTPEPKLPLSSLDSPKNICAFVGEILVATQDRLYGVSFLDDYNYWNVPLSDLNIDVRGFQLHCIESQGTAIVLGTTEGSNEKTLLHLRGNSGYRQDRRYPHRVVGISVDHIASFDFLNSVVTVGQSTQGFGFWQSYIDPVVLVQSKSVTADTTVNVTVSISNGGKGSKTVDTVSKVTVHKSASEKE